MRAGRYPPMGERSFGPFRAAQYGGADYWQHANEEVLLFAMIETRQAVEQPGRDPVGEGPQRRLHRPVRPVAQPRQAADARPSDKEVLAAMDTILKTTRKKGLIAGVHTDGAKTAHHAASRKASRCAPSSTTCACWP